MRNPVEKRQLLWDRELSLSSLVKQSNHKIGLVKEVKDGLEFGGCLSMVSPFSKEGWKVKGKGRWVRKGKLRYAPT